MPIGVDYVKAQLEIAQHITSKDIEELGDIDEADLAGALVALLAEAGVEDPEDLLTRAGILEP